MKKEWILSLLAVVIFIQIMVPVSMMVRREMSLTQGVAFRFKTAPVDPYDAFRGRYVALRLEGNVVPKPAGMDLRSGQNVFALLVVDENGFARINQVALQRPAGDAYMMAIVEYSSNNDVSLRLPIDRYYMEEHATMRAERVYREHSRRDKQDAFVVVRIKRGFAVVEGLYIGGRRIEDVLRSGV